MSDSPLPVVPPRYLLLDRSHPGGPRWLFVTAAGPHDTRRALLDDNDRYIDWRPVTRWVHRQVPGGVLLLPVTAAKAWRITEEPGR